MVFNLIDFLIKGGPFMIPLGLCSVVSLTFILERSLALRRTNIVPPDLFRVLFQYKIGQPVDEVERAVARDHSTLASLVRVCLEHLPWSKSENVEALQTRARTEVTRMERGLIVLEITTGIAPLLGLLGTVSGLVTVFGNIGETGVAEQGAAIARGIAEALNTTVVGLVVAIPSLIAHSYFSKKIESMTVEMESICMDLLTKFYLAPGDGSQPATGPNE